MSSNIITSCFTIDYDFVPFLSQFKPVNSQHLIDAFAFVMNNVGNTDFDFETAFRTWELQAGYPMIHVSYVPSRQFHVTQQRYFTNKNQTLTTPSSWYIPLNFATATVADFEDTYFSHYYVNNQDMIMIDVPAQHNANDWFIFNKQQLGYYRVNYDQSNWNALAAFLSTANFNRIHVLNRAQLLDDLINFASGGYVEYDVVYNLLSYLHRETEYTPWFAADRFISTLYTTFGPNNADLNVTLLAFLSRYKNFDDVFYSLGSR